MAFNVLLRTFDDIVVVANPSWLSVRNLISLVGLLLLVIVAVGARGWAMERRIRQQNASSAYVERRRGQILEDINGSRPLAEILEQITELVSFRLKGAPCSGARLSMERSWEIGRRSWIVCASSNMRFRPVPALVSAHSMPRLTRRETPLP